MIEREQDLTMIERQNTSFSASARAWRSADKAWLAVGVAAYVLMCVQMFLPLERLWGYSWASVGVLAQIGEAALVYGVGLPFVIGTILSFLDRGRKGGEILIKTGGWIWHAGVLAGVVLTGMAKGSGIAGMPFPSFVWPVLIMAYLPAFNVFLADCFCRKEVSIKMMGVLLFLLFLLLAGGFALVYLAGLAPYYMSLAARVVRFGIVGGVILGFVPALIMFKRKKEGVLPELLFCLYLLSCLLFPMTGTGRPWEFYWIARMLVYMGPVVWAVLMASAFFKDRGNPSRTSFLGSGFNAMLMTAVSFVFVMTAGVVVPSWKSGRDAASKGENGKYFSEWKSPVTREGSKLYGQLGCALCHSQSLSASDNALDYTAISRITVPDDFEGEYAAYFSDWNTAPVLTSLAGKIRQYITLENADGNEVRYGTEREWLLLHMYNPRDPLFGNSGSVCPPLPFLFYETNGDSVLKGSVVLPVEMPEGKVLVASESARVLADYLLSLDRNTPLPEEMQRARASFLPSGRQEFTLAGKEKRPGLSEEEVFLKAGAQVFSSQCSVCHGHDGTGDGFNYPPLAGSEWLGLPPEVLCDIVLRGLRGPLEVKGKSWDNFMTPQAARLTDEQVAAVVTYVLKTFAPGNAKTVDSVMVKELRIRAKDAPPLIPSELHGKYLKKAE